MRVQWGMVKREKVGRRKVMGDGEEGRRDRGTDVKENKKDV